MNTPRHPRGSWFLLFVTAAVAPVLPSTLLAQAAAPGSASGVEPKEEVVALSPFEVTADQADSYSALNTNSVTRFRQDLATLPVSADVFTETFMDDVAATSLEEMVVNYGTGTGVGGSNPESAADANRPGDRASNVNVKIRGLDAGQMRINSFGQGGIDDTFAVERVDVVRGPQSLLNGGVGGGGVINAVSKRARFESRITRFKFRLDDNGSRRGEFDYGIGGRRLALRVAGMLDDTRRSRVLIGDKAKGIYAQAAAKLTATTTARIETGRKWDRTVQSDSTELSMPAATINGVRLPADPRHNLSLHALLTLGQTADIVGGKLNWSNIDSFKGAYFGAERDNTHYEGNLEQKLAKLGTLQLAAMYDVSSMNRAEENSFTNLSAPLRNNNPLNEWAIGFYPGNTHESFTRRGYRANLASEFDLFGDRAHNQVLLGAQYETVYNKRRTQIYFLTDGNGNIVVNPAQVTNQYIGRTQMPVQWFSVENGPLRDFPWGRGQSVITGQDGRQYALADRIQLGAVQGSPTNPLGALGGGSFWDQYGYTDSYYAAMSTDWFKDRFTTLAGYRLSHVEFKRYEIGDHKSRKSTPGSLNLGVNFKLNRFLRPYYGYSNAFNPPDIVQFGPDGEVTKASKSIGHEFGLKFDPKSGRFSGSIAYFTVDSKDEQVSIDTTLRQQINPNGINGTRSPNQNWINVDRKSSGGELILTAKPTDHWKSRLSLALTDGRVGQSKRYGIMYNDEFHTDGKGGVTFADGTALLVAVDPAKQKDPSAPRQQLTIAMMNDASSPYFAVLDPDSGRITNASALLLNTSNANGSPVATGRVGLPISAHQLHFTDPNNHQGFITVSQAGEPTSGYAQYSANFTNSYEFTQGFVRGLTVGGTLFYRAKYRTYPYTQLFRDATGKAVGSERRMFGLPDSFQVSAFVSYRRKLSRRLEWSTQVNIDNLFNHYRAVILPNGSSGDPTNARLTFEPRTFVWTNTLSF